MRVWYICVFMGMCECISLSFELNSGFLFLTFIDFLWISHSDSTYLLVPLNLPSALANCPTPNKTKFKRKAEIKTKKQNCRSKYQPLTQFTWKSPQVITTSPASDFRGPQVLYALSTSPLSHPSDPSAYFCNVVQQSWESFTDFLFRVTMAAGSLWQMVSLLPPVMQWPWSAMIILTNGFLLLGTWTPAPVHYCPNSIHWYPALW